MEKLDEETHEKICKAYDLLINLQPHIPQVCRIGHEGFIDNYVDPVIEILGGILNREKLLFPVKSNF